MALQFGHIPGVVIRGTGAYFPPRTVTNEDVLALIVEHYMVREDDHGPWNRLRNAGARALGRGYGAYLRRKHPSAEEMVKRFGYPPAILDKVGVSKRQWAHPVGARIDAQGETSADLALHAAKAALDDAGLAPSEVDALVVTTTTPPRLNSSQALWLADRLGVVAPAYDLRAGCSGGLYGLINAMLYLQAGARNVLVVGSEAYSRFVSPCSRDAVFVAGDGAGAAVLSREEGERGVLAGLFGADGQYDQRFYTKGPMPPTAEAVEKGHYYVQGDPRGMVEPSFRKYLEIIPEVLGLAGVDITEIGYHVPHQTSLSVIKSVANRIGMPMERTFVNIHEHGNIGSACLLAGLHEARAAGKLEPGSKLLLSVVGGTMTWGSLVLQL